MSKKETPTITIDTDKGCSRCGEPGATQNGLCLDCIAKRFNTVKKEKRLCRYEFSKEEKTDIANDLANSVADLQRMDDNKKSVMSQIKSEMDAKQSAINLAAERHRSGFEMRDLECEVVYAYVDDVVRWIRTDTGEVAHERKMRPDERQADLPLESSETKVTMHVK
jgi:hypothetical protein